MRIGIQTWGGAGDIRPFLALAAGLANAGHEVRLVHGSVDGTDHTASSTDVGYERRLIVSSQSAAEVYRIGDEILSDGSPLRQIARVMRELLEPMIDQLTQSACELAKWADLLVLNPFAHPLAAASEAARKPLVCVYTGATVATREFPPPGLPHLGALNLITWKVSLALFSATYIGSVNRVRARLGLEPVKRVQHQLRRSVIDLVALSPTLMPRPRDWPDKVHLLGFFNSPPRQEKLEPELREFLARGPAPVYVTFEGMSSIERNPRTLIELAEEALETLGHRAIVQSALPGRASPNVFCAGALAPDQVFPRCSAIIHHGGAETAQVALRFGRPSVVIAHLPDHFLWGRRLCKLGVAPPHLDRGDVNTKQLIRAIEKATRDPAMRAAAERLGEKMRQEDGVQRAVELIEGVVT